MNCDNWRKHKNSKINSLKKLCCLNGVVILAYQVYVELGRNTILFTKNIKNNSENIFIFDLSTLNLCEVYGSDVQCVVTRKVKEPQSLGT